METKNLIDLAVKALEDLKAQDIEVLDVSDMTTITDAMVIASGTSNRRPVRYHWANCWLIAVPHGSASCTIRWPDRFSYTQ